MRCLFRIPPQTELFEIDEEDISNAITSTHFEVTFAVIHAKNKLKRLVQPKLEPE